VLVVASEEQQMSRVMAREGCTAAKPCAAASPASSGREAPGRQRRHRNSGDEAATQRQVEELVRKLLATS